MADKNYQVAELAEKAKAGNKAATEQLVDFFHGDIFRMVYYRTGSRMDAEDITQEIFIQVVKSLPGLRDASRFKPWLFSIALNRIRDFYRKKSILTFFGMTMGTDDANQITTESHDNPANNLMQKEFWKQFHQLTKILSLREREVFILRFVDNLGIREIAKALKKNESTVKTHLYRALKKFRQHPALHDLLKGNAS